MARRNSKAVKQSNMSQKLLRRIEKKKKNSNPRKDGKDWTYNVFKKLNNLKNKE